MNSSTRNPFAKHLQPKPEVETAVEVFLNQEHNFAVMKEPGWPGFVYSLEEAYDFINSRYQRQAEERAAGSLADCKVDRNMEIASRRIIDRGGF